jgi:hypothetical protein
VVKDLDETCTAITSVISTAISSSTASTVVSLQRNRALNLLLQRLLSLHAQLPSMVGPFVPWTVFLSLSHVSGPAEEFEQLHTRSKGCSRSCSRERVIVSSYAVVDLFSHLPHKCPAVLLSYLKLRKTLPYK